MKFFLMALCFIAVQSSIFCEILLSQFHVFTVNLEKSSALDYLIEGCESHNIPIDVLGVGRKGLGRKLFFIKKYINDVPDEDLVLFLGGGDEYVMVLASQFEIIQRFLEKGIQCIFSGDIQLWPWRIGKLREHFNTSPTPFKFLNSKFFIGYAGYLKKMFQEIGPMQILEDDQAQCVEYYVQHQNEILLDSFCEFFLPLNDINKKFIRKDVGKRQVYCKMTKTSPFFIYGEKRHFLLKLSPVFFEQKR